MKLELFRLTKFLVRWVLYKYWVEFRYFEQVGRAQLKVFDTYSDRPRAHEIQKSLVQRCARSADFFLRISWYIEGKWCQAKLNPRGCNTF